MEVVDIVAGNTVFIRPAVVHVEVAMSGGDLQSEFFMGDICRHFGSEPYWSDGYQIP